MARQEFSLQAGYTPRARELLNPPTDAEGRNGLTRH